MNLTDLPLFEQQTSSERPSLENQALSVSELTQQIKNKVEPAFIDVWVKGEMSNYRPAASGHVYFSLKDSQASLSVAAFGWLRKKTGFQLKDGLEVICHGKISVYPPRGSYQIVVDQIQPLGAGALQLAFEQLKEKLQNEGLFDPSKRKALPRFPSRIAVITSASGAAIRDVLNVLQRRAPQINVVVVPAVVQGDQGATQIVKAIEKANELRLGELILLTRGGGSIEDLWCFNEETVARAISKSELPIISAVGHEIDFTISDFVSDLRAPTPSAGAEILSENWVKLDELLKDLNRRFSRGIQKEISRADSQLKQLRARLVSPKDKLAVQVQRCDELQSRLHMGIQRSIERKKRALEICVSQMVSPKESLKIQKQVISELNSKLFYAMMTGFKKKKYEFESLIGKMDALSPLKVLERGYSIVKEGESQRVIRKASELGSNTPIEINFHDGVVEAITK